MTHERKSIEYCDNCFYMDDEQDIMILPCMMDDMTSEEILYYFIKGLVIAGIVSMIILAMILAVIFTL